MYKRRDRQYSKVTSMPVRHPENGDLEVHGNLVVTPAQMMAMRDKGIPISGQNIGMLPQDGESNPSFDLPLDRLRGVDPAEMWEASQIIKQKAKAAHDGDRKRFGDGELIQRDNKKK